MSRALLVLLALAACAAPAHATDFTVNDFSGTGDGTCDATCPLHDAIDAANANGVPDRIFFATGGVILLTTALPQITEQVAIDAGSAALPVVVDGQGAVTTFDLQAGADGSVVAGLEIRGSSGPGVHLDGPDNATVTDNVIVDNATDGVLVESALSAAVLDNVIGLEAGGTAAPNGVGVRVIGGATFPVTIGAPGNGNVVSGNTAQGILVDSPSVTTAAIRDNVVGADASGTAARPNGGDGIAVTAESATLEGNLVSGNAGDGVQLQGVTGGPVRGNRIGTTTDGTGPLPNGGAGVRVATSTPVDVGGVTPGAGNRIAFNAGSGVVVVGGTETGVQGNSISGNGGLGIDLADDGLTPNDAGDGDAGANDLTNFPVVDAAQAGGTVAGRMEALPGEVYRVELFTSAACDPAGNGEGDVFLARTTVTTGADGEAGFSVPAGAAAEGEVVTATATRVATGATSELSACRAVAGQAPDEPASPATPAPAPVETPPAAPPPDGPPVPPPSRSILAVAEGGRVVVTPPGAAPVALAGSLELPLGTRVDAREGRVRLFGPGGSAVFSGGVFVVTQDAAGLVDLRLVGALGPCPRLLTAARLDRRPPGRSRTAAARRLLGDGEGRFRISGQHSSAAIRGTRWLVEDACAGTTTRVERGIVLVTDHAVGRALEVRAGRSYRALPLRLPTRGRTVNLVTGDRFRQVRADGAAVRDAGRAAIRVIVAAADRPTQWATFTEGAFTVRQDAASLTTLTLADPLRCGDRRARSAQRKRRRRLWGDGEGKFRVAGKHSAAVVRGTRWLVEDTCAATTTRVARGVVAVEDFGRRVTVEVRAGRSYVARARR